MEEQDRNQTPAGGGKVLNIMDTAFSKTERFWDFTFKFGKAVSGVFVLIFFLVFAFSLLGYIFGGAPDFEVPNFKDVQPLLDDNTKAGVADFSGTDERLKVEQKFNDDIKKLITKYSLSQEGYSIILNVLVEMPEELRSDFIKGAHKFIDRGLKYAKSNNKELGSAALFNMYREIFGNNVYEWKQGEALAQSKKYQKLGVIGGSLLMFIVFLAIPLLIKIEENTRA